MMNLHGDLLYIYHLLDQHSVLYVKTFISGDGRYRYAQVSEPDNTAPGRVRLDRSSAHDHVGVIYSDCSLFFCINSDCSLFGETCSTARAFLAILSCVFTLA